MYKKNYNDAYLDLELLENNLANPEKEFYYLYCSSLVIYGLNIFIAILYIIDKSIQIYRKINREKQNCTT